MTLSLSSQTKALALGLAALFIVVASLALAPQAHAAAITLTTATTTSNNASTTLAKVGDIVSYQIVLSGIPWEAPKINILNMGTTSFSGSGTNWTYSTTTTSSWTNGPVSFMFSYGGTTVVDATSTKTQANLTGNNVTFDQTAPTGYTVDISAFVTAATAASASFSFAGAEVGASYLFQIGNGTASTTGSGTISSATQTVSGIDLSGFADGAFTLNASLMDPAGNRGATTSDTTTLDKTVPSTPTSDVTSGTTFTTTLPVTLSSTGSNSIRYTTDGTTPTCSVGTVASGAITLSESTTISAVGCDTAGNISSVASFFYIKPGSGGGGGSSSRRNGSGGGSVYVATGVPTDTTPTAPVTTTPSFTVTPIFTRDLFMGVVGDDVMALQAFLNTHGFALAASGVGSLGMETTTFGPLTRAAVARFQAAQGIAPAVGRFGPLTRAAVTAMMK